MTEIVKKKSKKPRIPNGACQGFIFTFGYAETTLYVQLILVQEEGYYGSVELAATELAAVLWAGYLESVKSANVVHGYRQAAAERDKTKYHYTEETPNVEEFEQYVYRLTELQYHEGLELYESGWINPELPLLKECLIAGTIHEVPESAEHFFSEYIPELAKELAESKEIG